MIIPDTLLKQLRDIRQDIRQHQRAVQALHGLMVKLVEEECHVDIQQGNYLLDLDQGTIEEDKTDAHQRSEPGTT